METIVVAFITAVASVIVAIMQTWSAAKNSASPHSLYTESNHSPSLPSPSAKLRKVAIHSMGESLLLSQELKAWLKVTVVISIMALLGPALLEQIPYINILAIPLVTIFLATFRPIVWGWAAVLVAFLHGINYLGYHWHGSVFTDFELQNSLAFYVFNAAIVSAFSQVRFKVMKRQGI